MTTKIIDRVYGTQEKALLLALRGNTNTCLYPFAERGEGVLLVRTMYMLILTVATEAITKKHQIGGTYNTENAIEHWHKLQTMCIQAEVRPTTELRETDAGNLARKFVSIDGKHTVYVEKSLLDIWASNARSLADMQFYALDYYNAPVDMAVIRVERSQGCTLGYIMPMHGLRKQTY